MTHLIAINIPLGILTFFILTFYAQAETCLQEGRTKDVRHSLPAAIEQTLPNTMGVEMVTSHTIRKNNLKLAAAILVPKQRLAPCDNNEVSNDGDVRTLVVWRHNNSGWLEIGRNAAIVYPVSTAGSATVSLRWYSDTLYLEQYSNLPPRIQLSDDYGFNVDEVSNKVWLAHRKSTFFYPMCCGDPATLETAEKKHGNNVCNYSGFEGEIDYLSGEASIVQCEFAQRRISKSLMMNSKPMPLESITNVSFENLEIIKSSSVRLKSITP